MAHELPLGRRVRIGARVAAGFIALALLVAVPAPALLRGARFGHLVVSLLPETRGQVHIGGGRWSWGSVLALARGRAAPIVLDDVRVIDPEGTEVLYAGRLAGWIELHRAPFRVVVHDVRVERARWRFARMSRAAETGFLAAFEPAHRDAAVSGSGGGLQLAIRGAHLDGVDATVDLPDWQLGLRDVHGGGSLDVRSNALAFEVTGADARGGGRLRVLAAPPLSFEHARIDRVGTVSGSPDAIRVEASNIASGRSRLAVRATFDGPAIDAVARADAAADVVNALAAGWAPFTVGDRVASLVVRITGPLVTPTIEADAAGFDLEGHGLQARDVGFHLRATPLAGAFELRRLSLASPAGGRLRGELALQGSRLGGELAFIDFGTAPLLPLPLRPFATGTLNGTVRARADLRAGTATLERGHLRLVRAPGLAGPRTLALRTGPDGDGRGSRTSPAPSFRLSGVRFTGGAIRLPRVALSLWGGRFAADGRVAIWDTRLGRWLPAPLIDLTIVAEALDVERLAGAGFARGAVSFRARARGSLADLTATLEVIRTDGLTVLGESFRLPSEMTLRLTDTGLVFPDLRLAGPRQSELRCAGRVAFSGRLALTIGVRDFPIDRLPGFERTALPISGSLSGDLRLSGRASVPAVTGQLSLAPVTFQGRSVGGGRIEIAPQPGGGIRARGLLVEGIGVDGFLAPGPSGLAGEATLTLRELRLDPFLAALPGGLAATGVLSGSVVARIAPGRPAAADGRLSALTLIVTPPAGGGDARHAIALHSEGEIRLAAHSGEGPIAIGPARFRGDAGVFELWGESLGDSVRGTVRGRIELGVFAPLAAPWLDRLVGAIDVDVAAARTGAAGGLRATGSLAIAAPLSFRLASLPFEARIASGRLRLTGDAIETDALPVTVRAEGMPFPAIKRLDAQGRISARVDGTSLRPRARARFSVDGLELLVPAIGPGPIHAAAGTVELASQGRGVEVTRVDLPLAGQAERMAVPGASIEKAAFALRLRGAPRDQMQLSGDVSLLAARVGARAAATPPAPPREIARNPELERMRLDLALRSSGGAVRVDAGPLPDLRVDVDMRVGGTIGRPAIVGEPRGANIYSAIALALRRLFH